MNEEFSLRNEGETSKREHRKPNICECKHDKDDHVDNLFRRGNCMICTCPKYIRDKDLEGYYVECVPLESDISYHSMARGTFYLKQVSVGKE